MNESQKSLWQLLFAILTMALQGVKAWFETRGADDPTKGH